MFSVHNLCCKETFWNLTDFHHSQEPGPYVNGLPRLKETVNIQLLQEMNRWVSDKQAKYDVEIKLSATMGSTNLWLSLILINVIIIIICVIDSIITLSNAVTKNQCIHLISRYRVCCHLVSIL